jgi:hypothetical protein
MQKLKSQKISEKSVYEIEMEEALKECKKVIENSFLTIKDSEKIICVGFKILGKCEELRVSRDKWREKALKKL